MPGKVEILDVTIRDGSYAIDYSYTPRQVGAIAGALDSAGIHYIEVSHGCGLGACDAGISSAASDEEYVAAARRAVKNAKIGVIAGSEFVTKRHHIDAVSGMVDFIRFAANVDDVGSLEKNIAYARGRGVRNIFVQMMRSSRKPVKEVIKSAKHAEKLGANTVYLVDTAGFYTPENVAAVIGEMKNKLKAKVGFHAHNNLCLAVANTMAAIDAGADTVDASLRGMGRGAGNAQLEALVTLMQRKKLARDVSLQRLLDAGQDLVAPLMPPSHGIGSIDVATAGLNIDIYPLQFFEMLTKSAGIGFNDFVKQLASDNAMVEVDFTAIKNALKHFKVDGAKLLSALGIREPENK